MYRLQKTRHGIFLPYMTPTDSFPPPPWIGTDESGKGDYFGPLVVAGVYVSAQAARPLTETGVRDSKLLADERALSIADSIQRICRGAFYILELKPETYNSLYARFKSEKKNLNDLLGWAHAKVIEDLLARHPCPTVITDKFGNEKYIRIRLTDVSLSKKTVFIQRPRAEENVAVAAASILARARLVQWSRQAEREWGMKIPKGATHVKEAAREFMRRHGKEKLGLAAKLHFKTTKEIYFSGM